MEFKIVKLDPLPSEVKTNLEVILLRIRMSEGRQEVFSLSDQFKQLLSQYQTEKYSETEIFQMYEKLARTVYTRSQEILNQINK